MPARIIPSRTIKATVAALFACTHAARAKSFATEAVDHLDLSFDGIAGDRHGGTTRRSGGREPWYARGTEMRNERQLSIVSADDLAGVAADMGIPEIRPEWIGANIVIAGVPDLTLLPPRSLIMLKDGPTIRIDGLNVPCRLSGRAIAAHYADREGLDIAFVKAARYRRGLVGYVEKPGRLSIGDHADVRIPEHWLYE
jgi:hypothetical protein